MFKEVVITEEKANALNGLCQSLVLSEPASSRAEPYILEVIL